MSEQTHKPKRLISGVDTLYLNVCYADESDVERKGKRTLDDDLAYQLDDLKSMAKEQEQDIATPWIVSTKEGNAPLMMKPHGAGKGQWSWLLTSPFLDVSISHGRLSGNIAQVRLSSRFLWSEAWAGDALSNVHGFLIDIFGNDIYLQISEVHLCTDIMGWSPETLDWQERFISRAVGDDGHPYCDDGMVDGPESARRRWKHINALTFGQHTSRISCIVYDKTLEIAQASKKVWFHKLWKDQGWDEVSKVWRVEVRFKREFLRAVNIDYAYDFLGQMQRLWAYAVGNVNGDSDGFPNGWLRLAIPSTDSNRSRWDVDPIWTLIQHAFHKIPEYDLGAFVFKQEKEATIKRLVQQIAGCVTSVAAQGNDLYPQLGLSYYDVMEWLTTAIEAHHKVKQVSFQSIVTNKRVSLFKLAQ